MRCIILSVGRFGLHTQIVKMYKMFGKVFFIFSKCLAVVIAKHFSKGLWVQHQKNGCDVVEITPIFSTMQI